MKTYTFHVHGMHCKACILLIESTLNALPNVSRAHSSLATHTVLVTGDFPDTTPEDIARNLTVILRPHGYTLSLERQTHAAQWSHFKIALPIAAGFIALFIILQRIGIINLVTASEVTYSTAFIIGLIASVSTCMAVVGGLALSLSAHFVQEGDRIRPQILFHLGRLISFFILGGAIGALGSALQLGAAGTVILSIIVALVLLILGINLLDIFPWMKKLQPTMPRFISRYAHDIKNINHTLTPLAAGIATFFLPCGFTQSMQIYTLTTGSFLSGALIMLSFALGTFPVLALLSFGSLGIHTKTQSGIFFKAAGLVVIFFGFFNLINALVAANIIPPLWNF